MKTMLVIPSKNQVQYIPDMLRRIDSLSVKPDIIWYYLDRPTGRELIDARKLLGDRTDIEMKVNRGIPEWVGHPQMNYGEEYFLTGYIRNTAIMYAIETGVDCIIFIDGDCMPESDLIKEHTCVLSVNTPAATVGRRRESKWQYEDQRVMGDIKVPLFADTAREYADEFFFADSGVVWTCNFGINMAAIRILLDRNETLYGRREVFSSDFSGTWGGEDGFIGLECLYFGIPVFALPPGPCGIVHKDHERPIRKYDHIMFIDYLEYRREELLARMGLFGLEHPEFVDKETLRKQSHAGQ